MDGGQFMMSDYKKLCIAIRTHNREKYLKMTLDKFVQNCPKEAFRDVYVLVLDNYSDAYNFKDVVEKYKKYDIIKFNQNIANIGASANYLRCMEIGNAEYIWILSDDENPDFGKLSSLLEMLGKCDIYCLPHSESWFKKNRYYGVIKSESKLLDNFFHMGVFASSSIFIFKKESVLKYLKIGYEMNTYQHAFLSMSLMMLHNGCSLEILKLPIFKNINIAERAPCRYALPRAHIDVVCSYTQIAHNKKKYLKLDLPLRKKDIFFPLTNFGVTLSNFGITNKINIENRIFDYKRLLILLPPLSHYFYLCILYILFYEIRKNNFLTTLAIFIVAKVRRKRKFGNMKFKEMYLALLDNICLRESGRD